MADFTVTFDSEGSPTPTSFTPLEGQSVDFARSVVVKEGGVESSALFGAARVDGLQVVRTGVSGERDRDFTFELDTGAAISSGRPRPRGDTDTGPKNGTIKVRGTSMGIVPNLTPPKGRLAKEPPALECDTWPPGTPEP